MQAAFFYNYKMLLSGSRYSLTFYYFLCKSIIYNVLQYANVIFKINLNPTYNLQADHLLIIEFDYMLTNIIRNSYFLPVKSWGLILHLLYMSSTLVKTIINTIIFIFAGSISDVSAFQNTDLYQALETFQAGLPENGILPHCNIQLPFFYIGDAIFTLASYLMKPFARVVGLTERQRTFNYR